MAENYKKIWGPPELNRAAWAAHSTITYVSCDDPPTFLSCGDADEFRTEQMNLMAKALERAGVEHQLAVTPRMGHWVVVRKEVLGAIYDFFDKHLKAEQASPSPAPSVDTRKTRRSARRAARHRRRQ